MTLERKFKVSFLTDKGRKRQQNQDSGAIHPELGLFIVADGMGGHRGGEIASAFAVEAIYSHVRAHPYASLDTARVALKDSITVANKTIFNKSQAEESLRGMGTTAVALLFQDQHAIIGHVGDSRCYYFKPNSVWQLTRDHSWVQERLRAGVIKREQAKTDRLKNVITRSVGHEPHVDVDVYELLSEKGDVFLLCSDGLSGLIEDQGILEIVQEKVFKEGLQESRLDEAAKILVDTANQNGGDDNITVILVQRVE